MAPYQAALRTELTGMGYAPASVRDIVWMMARLSVWMDARSVAVTALSPAMVEEFVAVRREVTRTEGVAGRGLGPVLRFLHVEGMISAPLAPAVPAVAGWRLAALPGGLEPGQVEAVLAGPDPSTPAGLRDRAVLTVLARLGLRGAEAAALGLADVDWRAGEIIVRGKGSCLERIPLPVDVGEALAGYLTAGRPACSCPALFVTARAPYHGLNGSAVRAIMGRACRSAGLPRLGAHRLRHSLATHVLRAGAPLTEVGQLLARGQRTPPRRSGPRRRHLHRRQTPRTT